MGGAVVSALDFQGDVRGQCSRSDSTPVEMSHQWHIGSCTKAITASLFAKLVENGEASWEAPITEYFSDLKDRLHPDWNERPIEEFFHCMGGMIANPSLRERFRLWEDTRPLIEQRSYLAVQAMQVPPRKAGQFVYSNMSYIIIGAVIDRIVKASYEIALEQLIFQPLGIESAGYGAPPNICGHGGKLNLGFASLFKGKPMSVTDKRNDNAAAFSSAGTLHLTLEDWAKFVRIFLPDENPILKPSSVERILSGPAGARMFKGWVPSSAAHLSFIAQGSNTMWVATAMINKQRDKVGLIVCNDGRTRVLMQSLVLCEQMLES